MIYLKILLGDNKVDRWIEREKFNVSSILMILKKNLGYKNQGEIIRKTNLDPSFLKIKLCWKTDTEYSEITKILNDLIEYYTSGESRYFRYRGRVVLEVVAKGGKLEFVPYYKMLEGDGEKSLMYWTIEKSIERWIKEKF